MSETKILKASPERIAKGLWWDRAWSLVSGCTPVSAACDSCWAATEANMRAANPNDKIKSRNKGLTEGTHFNGTVRFNEDLLDLPLKTKKPAVWAVWTDLFHEDVPEEFIDRAFAVMALTPQHTFMILTKRPERMARYLSSKNIAFRIAKAIDEICVANISKKINPIIVPIDGYTGYFIKNDGTVYSSGGSSICVNCGEDISGYAKSKFCSKKCKSRAEYLYKKSRNYPFKSKLSPMSPDIGSQGYCRVMLYKDGSPYRELVHRLVLSHFVSKPRPGDQACHVDGNPLNNHIANLRWGAQEDNWKDRIRHGHGQSNKSDKTKIPPPIRLPLDNLMLGVTAENQEQADKRIPILLDTPAAKRFISQEPSLGPADLIPYLGGETFKCNCGYNRTESGEPGDIVFRGGKRHDCLKCKTTVIHGPTLDLVILGGESGPKARPMHPDYARKVRDDCAETETPFFFKQNGEWRYIPSVEDSRIFTDKQLKYFPELGETFARVGKKKAGCLLDGKEHKEWPE